jgi:hypothetical protein
MRNGREGIMSFTDRITDEANGSTNIGNCLVDRTNAPALYNPHVVAVRVMWQTLSLPFFAGLLNPTAKPSRATRARRIAVNGVKLASC